MFVEQKHNININFKVHVIENSIIFQTTNSNNIGFN